LLQPDAMNLIEPLQPPGHLPLGAGHALLPGAMLEDFEITQVLGLTSFGVLYLATHVIDHNVVAIKEYLPAGIATRNPDGQIELTDPAQEEAFQRGLQSFVGEALSLSQFDHPHLLKVNCVWEANGTAYRAMPCLSGASLLAQRSGMNEPATQAQLQTLLDGLLDALDTLNRAGLAHGQVEPINIFMVNGEQPVLMDFDAVHHAVLSDLTQPHLDNYANPETLKQTAANDLHAVAAVLHFAISNHWSPLEPGEIRRYEPLADVLTRFKDSASALGYTPEFLGAIDATLALPPAERPRSVKRFRAFFDLKLGLVPNSARSKATHAPKHAALERPQNEYPLNSSESVLALLANFGSGPASASDEIEPFENPPVPTLTEEAEPALPPMRTSLFDAMDAGESLPLDGVGYGRRGYRPMPPIPANSWRRYMPAIAFGLLALACVGVLGWVMTA